MSLQSLIAQIKLINSADNIAGFKACIANSYEWLNSEFSRGDVTGLVMGRATFIDSMLRHLWRLSDLNQQKHLSLIAVGGYGRGQLQPYSDIDLLILSSKSFSKSQQDSISRFITLLWDIGLDLGQSVRTIKETYNHAKQDVTIATNLVEARLLIGSQDTFEELQEKLQSRSYWSSKDFFLAKLEEQTLRHSKFKGTSYNLEPNIKESPGCLRDIQSIGWVAKKHFKVIDGTELINKGYFNEQELEELIECRNHLWRMRFALHLIAGRSENRLLFDFQTDVAAKLGYGEDGKASVERMMKAFFRTVRRISELNEMLLQRFSSDVLAAKVKVSENINSDFEVLDGLIAPRHNDVFNTPEDILLFLLTVADNPQINGLHSSSLRQLRLARRKFHSQYFAERPECRKLFMQLMKHPNYFAIAWDITHKHGIIQAYLPQWDHIVGMMQFDLFHAYTVDEHTHRLIKNVYHYGLPENKDFPRCGRIVKNLDKPELLYIAAIFHDIGKGRNGDHSKLGAIDVEEFCQTHEIESKDAELISWLVENHLLMSVIAQRRDIYDPDVINEFATQVRSHNSLNHLYVLTLADIRATNDNLWNDWKASLLRELFLLTQKALDNGLECKVAIQDRVDEHQTKAKAILLENGMNPIQIEQFWKRLSDDYFARFKPEQIAWHANVILASHPMTDDFLLVEANENTAKSGTELIVYGKMKKNMFAQIASVLDSRNVSIHDAQIMRTHDGYIFDSFIILEHNGDRINSASRLNSLKKAVETQLTKPGQDHSNKRKMSRQMKQLDVPTKVRFYPGHSNVTLVELEALDAPGLLAKIGELFVELEFNLHMAKISTIGERAEDLFIVSSKDNTQLTQNQQVQFKTRLNETLH
ncbi:MAG: [protein-PII] uridylyltransferase [Paraglaciecola sp.]|uniref:[protein-PII] uridylyltransferase n=1 Tax=Pseudomonadati TaxID=3379134 RepID=UPI0027400ED2|nr:[protein-PII] uridylyltransferase [Paraglaciecola sp.]MDP5029498.1 [protein-PII] uridylyltransferase [Paraglaciecola sp.]MDP5129289.1 [protein-PII] uridylyltransferase [Paraglaciecola sp.]